MKKEKISTTLIIISILLTFSLANIVNNVDNRSYQGKIHLSSKPMYHTLFEVGVQNGPFDLDPQEAWDYASYLTIDQVCEGLFSHNYSDPTLAIIPNLALSGSWNPAGTEYNCILRQGVTFHDGAPFNADAVIFNWNRMNWALNVTGTNFDEITQLRFMYEFPNGTPVVSSVVKNDDFNVTFILNGPYAPFESLLCFSGSYLLSPTSTPATAYIDTTTGDLVGTGPFVYDNYTYDVEVNFHAYDNYWNGKADILNMKYEVINDLHARHNALLTRDVHFINSLSTAYYPTIKASPNHVFLNTSTTSNTMYYLAMNNNNINRTKREAISYAIDYDYIINVLMENNAKRLKSPIPNGILYGNDTFDVPTLNVTRARLVMQSMGFGGGLNPISGGPDEANWEAATFFSVNYSYNTGNTFREDLGVLLISNLDKIGIEVTSIGMNYVDFIYRAYGFWGISGLNMMELFWIGWGADFNDPSTIINQLFTNSSSTNNAVQYNGYTAAIEAGRDPLDMNDNVQLLMDTALSEIDPVAREVLYDRIQEILVEEDYPWAWGYTSYVYNAYDQRLTGFEQNTMRRIFFYPCLWNASTPILPDPITIYTDADDPDVDGNFKVFWNPSMYADNYSLYVYSHPITEINGSITVLLDEVQILFYDVFGYPDGVYYFLAVAQNGNGNTTSLNLQVNVGEGDPPSSFVLYSNAENPDPDGDFTIVWTPSTNADNYSLYRHTSLITEINGSVTLLLDESPELLYEEFDYTDGTYYFVVVAKNRWGTTMSNNHIVIVELETSETPPDIPGFEVWTMIITLASVSVIVVIWKKKKFNY